MSLKTAEIEEILKNTEVFMLPDAIALYEHDERAGVKKIIEKYNKKYNAYKAELVRIEEMLTFEKQYPECKYIAGIDEVGRGPLAGPVVTCAVVFDKDTRILYANDSKKLSAAKREELYDIIIDKAVSYSIGIEGPDVIDDINILQATFSAMRKSINGLSVVPDLLLNDAVKIPMVDIKQVPIIKGDAKSMSIACASIVAKVYRDRMMEEYDKLYPEYGFASNKGYGSKEHIEALKKYGPCPIHRSSFIKNF